MITFSSQTDIFSLFKELILVYIVYVAFRMYLKKFDRRMEEMENEFVETENEKKKERNGEKMNEELRIENRKLKEEWNREKNAKNELMRKDKNFTERLEKVEKRDKNQSKELRALQLRNRKMTEELRMEKEAKDQLMRKDNNLTERLEKVENKEKNQAKELRALQLRNRKMTEELEMEKTAKDQIRQHEELPAKTKNDEEKSAKRDSSKNEKPNYLSVLSMECIIGYIDANKRLLLSLSADPTFKRIEKSVPLSIEHLSISKYFIVVNDTYYVFIRPDNMIRRFGKSSSKPQRLVPVNMIEDTYQCDKSNVDTINNIVFEMFNGRSRCRIDFLRNGEETYDDGYLEAGADFRWRLTKYPTNCSRG